MPVVAKLKDLSTLNLPTRARAAPAEAQTTPVSTPSTPPAPASGLTVEQLMRALQRAQRSAA